MRGRRPTRIVHCIETIASGGVEQRRLSIAKALAAPDYEHHIVCTRAIGPVAEALRAEGVTLTEVGTIRSIIHPHRYQVVARIVEDWEPDIIHGAIIEGYTLASVVGRIKRVPVVIMEETSDPRNRRWKGHLLSRAMAGLADHCLGVSDSVGRYLTDRLRIPERKVSVINNGVAPPRLPTPEQLCALQSELGIQGGDLVIGSVGRVFNDYKRFSDLIHAFRLLDDEFSAKLLIVGDGPDLPMLRELASQGGLADRVIFAGYQFEVGHYYALMDIFALASASEAFGLVNAEAMHCRLPVVATKVGGIPDIVADGVTGFLVAPRDAEALSLALRKLLTCADLRRQMGEAGKTRAEREFSADRYVADVESLYTWLLGRHRH